MNQHVDAAAVRHRHHDFTRAALRAARNRFVQHRNEDVISFDGEAFVAFICAFEEALQPVHLGEPSQHGDLFVGGERMRDRPLLHALLEPGTFVLAAQVGKLQRDRAAVHVAQTLHHVGGGASGESERGGRHVGQLVFPHTVKLGRQLWRAWRRRPERIELDGEVPVLADRFDKGRGRGGLAEEPVVPLRARRQTGQRLCGPKELSPRLFYRRRIAPECLVHLGDVAVVEDGCRRGEGAHAANLAENACARTAGARHVAATWELFGRHAARGA